MCVYVMNMLGYGCSPDFRCDFGYRFVCASLNQDHGMLLRERRAGDSIPFSIA